jgi:crossover junction endodeoxyribonuclease RuvC
LKIIFDGVQEVVQRYAPDCACAEIVFVNVNRRARSCWDKPGRGTGGVGGGGLSVTEYTALQMKKAIVGHGLASKGRSRKWCAGVLQLPALPGKDAADALGIAISHAHVGSSFAAIAQVTSLQRRQHAQYRKGRSY